MLETGVVLARDGGVLELHGGGALNDGLIHVAHGGELFLTSSRELNISGDGLIRIDEGGALRMSPDAGSYIVQQRIENSGLIELDRRLLLLHHGLDGDGVVDVRSGSVLAFTAPEGEFFELSNRVVLDNGTLASGGDGFVTVGNGVVTGSGTILGEIGGRVVAEGDDRIKLNTSGGSGYGITWSGTPVLETRRGAGA